MPALKLTLVAAFVGLAAPTGSTYTQQVAAATAQAPIDVQQLATVHVALLRAQDSLNAEMAHPRNKTAEGQARLQEALRTQVAAVLGGRRPVAGGVPEPALPREQRRQPARRLRQGHEHAARRAASGHGGGSGAGRTGCRGAAGDARRAPWARTWGTCW